MKHILRGICLLAVLLAAARCAPAQSPYSFDAAKSKLEIDVYKEGLFKAFGHDHLVSAGSFSGQVLFDAAHIENSSVTLRVPVMALSVLDPGESTQDRQTVQSTMLGQKVLDAAQFPEIVFSSTRVTRAQKKADAWSILLSGTLQLHGRNKSISLPLTLLLVPDGLDARGELYFLQSDFGIAPVRIAGGAVRVKDLLRIRFAIHALPAARP